MQAVFMTQDDQANCTFEPLVGSMNPSRLIKPDKVPKEATIDEMVEDHGTNFAKRHPEIWRKGVVRKANAYFVRGEYDACMTDQFKMFGDENYVNKFGALKRGLVLMSYGRYNDAHQVLAKAVHIVKQ
jgi:hypothetical protein